MVTNLDKQLCKILDFLKKNGESAESKILALTGIAYYVGRNRLTTLEEQGKIIRRMDGDFNYWRLKE